VKVGVKKKRMASSADVTPNRRKSPNLRPYIPLTCCLTSVIPLSELFQKVPLFNLIILAERVCLNVIGRRIMAILFLKYVYYDHEKDFDRCGERVPDV
jgi:hypothetical protein